MFLDKQKGVNMINKQKTLILCSLIIVISYIIGNNPIIAQTAQSFSTQGDDFITTDSDSNTTFLGKWIPNGPCEVLDIENNLLYTNNGTKLLIIDITDRANPVVKSETVISENSIQCIRAHNGYLYCSDGNTLHIIDISDPQNPEEISTCGDDQNIIDIVVEGNYVYVVDHKGYIGAEEGVRIIDIGDPINPSEVKFIKVESPNRIVLSGKYLILIGNPGWYTQNTFYSIDIEDPANPIISHHDLGIVGATSICLKDNNVFVIGRDSRINKSLFAINITDPTNPVSIASYNLEDIGFGTNAAINLVVKNDYLYLPCSSGSVDNNIRIMDISDPGNASIINSFETVGTPYNLMLTDNYAFVADGNGGLRIYGVNDINNIGEVNNIDESIELDFDDIAVYNNYAYITGYNEGLNILDISDKSNPTYIKSIVLPNDETTSLTIDGNYMYLLNEGLRVYDISNPSSLVEVGHLGGQGCDDIVVRGNLAYITNGHYLYIVDVSDKTNPYIIGQYNTNSSTTLLDELDVQDGYAYTGDYITNFNVSFDFRVIDISDPGKPYRVGWYLGTWGYSSWSAYAKGSNTDIFVKGSYLYATNSFAGFGIFNISDPANPTEVSFYRGNMSGMYVDGNFAYVLGYNGTNYLRILNISNPSAPVLAGFYQIDGLSQANITVQNGIVYAVTDKLYIIQNDEVTDIEVTNDLKPDKFYLGQNYPNPFNPSTRIRYIIPQRRNVNLKVFNLLGSVVAELVSGEQDAGSFDINFNAANLPSGIYFYRLQAGSFIETKKMLLLK